ncbi:alpha/beta fold hydrolase [Albimonas pacifica]|uniref:Alpha/beta hydrolase family protein n=1 Tax=Albimonas pacifica TaxID=1114924 RepID=A0A1I3J0Y4_9RHOB|nr:alpha/beta hydrolase [Albimonas pacifica]SFI53884.1 Alpha/beta hydrolase family protein [Albimonas pacifica]
MTLKRMSLFSAGALLAAAFAAASPARAEPVGNVVIVHGALADGSGWRRVHDLLAARGFTVTVVQPPMTSLADDVRAARRVLDLRDGPSVLVGHSYGGMIVTEAGRHDAVAGLVYVAAFQPDEGETLLALATGTPPATAGIKATADGFLYLDPAVFAADFAGDLPAEEAAFMARSQVMPAAVAFETPVGAPAWASRPSWALIPTEDRAINPELMRRMAERAGSVTVEVPGSHAVFASRPEAVADLIEAAAAALAPAD